MHLSVGDHGLEDERWISMAKKNCSARRGRIGNEVIQKVLGHSEVMVDRI